LQEVLHGFVKKRAYQFLELDGEANYQAAARDFRMLYWDWTLQPSQGQTYFPTSLTEKTVKVVQPGSKGKASPMDNPLYSYRFRELNPASDSYVRGKDGKLVRRNGKSVEADRNVSPTCLDPGKPPLYICAS